ncbi:MAG: Rad52/Rad22 family DNA repair protein [Pseudorhodoplanes sp.]|jgi:hypothetical protein|nr:Rad52/Rad22 family DNA repair protein [Pseudorhodoplanes sp.]
MGFTRKQQRLLRQNIKREHLRSREIQGREITYIEGGHAIEEANRIFGFSAWDRETVEAKCVLAREIRGQFTAVYLAKVRITVRAENETILREGQGTGEAQGATPGEAHDKALKSAETDATKRALATFGRPFGLGLYLGATNVRPNGNRAGAAHRHDADSVRSGAERASAPRAQWPSSAVRPEAQAEQGTVYPKTDNVAATQPRGAQSSKLQQPANDPPGSVPRPGIDIPGVMPPPFLQADAQGQPDDVKSLGMPARKATSHADQTVTFHPADNENATRRIDKSVLMLGAPKRFRDKKHLQYVANQPCLVCGRAPSDAHHLRFAQDRALGRKVSDEFTVPLCRGHHRQLHQSGNEIDWWQVVEIDPLPIAAQLWQEGRKRKNVLVTSYSDLGDIPREANVIIRREKAEPAAQSPRETERTSNRGEQA